MTLAAGASFPSLMLSRVGGGSLRVPRGPVLIFFFRDDPASGPPATALARVADELMSRGLTVVGVSADDPGGAAAFATEHGLGSIDLCHGGPSHLAASAAQLTLLPTTFLLDGSKVVMVVEGWSRQGYNDLAATAAGLVDAAAPIASHPGDGLPDFLAPEPAPAWAGKRAGTWPARPA